jgi:hypothetical protein
VIFLDLSNNFAVENGRNPNEGHGANLTVKVKMGGI